MQPSCQPGAGIGKAVSHPPVRHSVRPPRGPRRALGPPPARGLGWRHWGAITGPWWSLGPPSQSKKRCRPPQRGPPLAHSARGAYQHDTARQGKRGHRNARPIWPLTPLNGQFPPHIPTAIRNTRILLFVSFPSTFFLASAYRVADRSQLLWSVCLWSVGRREQRATKGAAFLPDRHGSG
jgi:hypothetical protein